MMRKKRPLSKLSFYGENLFRGDIVINEKNINETIKG
jgi:hypothetical protein